MGWSSTVQRVLDRAPAEFALVPSIMNRQIFAQAQVTIRFILEHPLNRGKPARVVARFVGWQIWKRLVRRPLTVALWNGLRIRAYPDSKAASLVIYTQLAEYDDMLFVMRFVRPEDVVVDVGANIGVYSLIAAATATKGIVLALEPHPTAASRLSENAALNGLGNIQVRVIAAGAKQGVAELTRDFDLTNHIVEGASSDTVQVPVTTLDAELDQYSRIALIKIDTEGFETDVLEGAAKLLDRLAAQVWLVEVNGLGARYATGDGVVRDIFRRRGYLPYRYIAENNALIAEERPGKNRWNLLYIRDLATVKERLGLARI